MKNLHYSFPYVFIALFFSSYLLVEIEVQNGATFRGAVI